MEIALEYLTDGLPGQRRARLSNPDWEQIKSQISNLDGLRKTELNLINESSGEELTVGGGRNRYIVSWLQSDGGNGTLVNPDYQNSEDMVELIVGGQSGTFPRKVISSLDQALAVAKLFVESKTLDSFLWD